FAGGFAAADLVAASGATAVVAHNDLVALGILDRLRSRGTLVPNQVSVVGFDDVPGATHVSPTLTTVSVPLQLLGRTAVDLLLDPERTMESALSGTHSGTQSSPQSSARPGAQPPTDPEMDEGLVLT